METSIAAGGGGTYNPAVRTLLAIPALLLLASCAQPMITPPQRQADQASSASEAAEPLESSSEDPAVTPEPFEDPLAPISLTGAVTVEERTLSGVLVAIGSENARIAMDVFLNPESPYAREFHRSRMPRVVSEFVATGRLAVWFHILPIDKYAGSAFAARAVSCAAAQGKGYPALDLLMRDGRTDLDADDLSELGIDETPYRSCIQTGTGDPFDASSRTIEQWGVTLVPTYVIHDQKFVGLPSEADMLGAIREMVR